ncbi:unnamed protein product [Discosporangium mesarthrocarpum]
MTKGLELKGALEVERARVANTHKEAQAMKARWQDTLAELRAHEERGAPTEKALLSANAKCTEAMRRFTLKDQELVGVKGKLEASMAELVAVKEALVKTTHLTGGSDEPRASRKVKGEAACLRLALVASRSQAQSFVVCHAFTLWREWAVAQASVAASDTSTVSKMDMPRETRLELSSLYKRTRMCGARVLLGVFLKWATRQTARSFWRLHCQIPVQEVVSQGRPQRLPHPRDVEYLGGGDGAGCKSHIPLSKSPAKSGASRVQFYQHQESTTSHQVSGEGTGGGPGPGVWEVCKGSGDRSTSAGGLDRHIHGGSGGGSEEALDGREHGPYLPGMPVENMPGFHCGTPSPRGSVSVTDCSPRSRNTPGSVLSDMSSEGSSWWVLSDESTLA